MRALLAMSVVALLSTACAPAAGAPPPAPTPAFCAPPATLALQEITGTPASPYFVHQPASRSARVPTVVFLCYGGDPRQVHLAGFSNGGHAAFELMLERPERSATLLGAPGEFPPRTTPPQWAAALKGKAVFNGVGELDDEFWHKGVRDAHEGLSANGVDSVYVEFKGQAHGARAGFPKDVLFEFWARHCASSPARGVSRAAAERSRRPVRSRGDARTCRRRLDPTESPRPW